MSNSSWQKRQDAERYGRIPSSDREEMVENRKARLALELLRLVEGDLDPSEFSLKEIREGFNAIVPVGGGDHVSQVRFGQSNLNWLVENGFIAVNEGGKTYRVVRSRESLPAEVDELYPEEKD